MLRWGDSPPSTRPRYPKTKVPVVNYNKARYDSFPNAPCYTGQTPAQGCTRVGNRTIQNLGGVSGDYLASPFGAPLSRQDGYVSVDDSLRLRTADGRLEFAVIGKNLTNRFYVTGWFEAPFTDSGTATATGVPADQISFAGLPRTVQAQLTVRY